MTLRILIIVWWYSLIPSLITTGNYANNMFIYIYDVLPFSSLYDVMYTPYYFRMLRSSIFSTFPQHAQTTNCDTIHHDDVQTNHSSDNMIVSRFSKCIFIFLFTRLFTHIFSKTTRLSCFLQLDFAALFSHSFFICFLLQP